jgi:hypothetical protein
MTFSDLQVLTSDWVDDPQNGYFTLSVLKKRLNLALKELQKRLISANEEYYSQCVTTDTVANQAMYSLPTDFLQIIRLERILSGSGTTANTQQILAMTPNQRDLIVDTSGDPNFYYLQKNNIILKPVPNRILTMHLEYSYLVADMVNDNDVPDAPEQFHEYIPVLAARDCFIKDGRPLGPIETKLKDYELLLKQIAVQRQADGPRMTVVTQGDYF